MYSVSIKNGKGFSVRMRRSLCFLLAFLTAVLPALCFSYGASFIYGDLDGDGKISAKDSLLMRRHLSGAEVEVNESAADINCDGKITSIDMTLLRRHLARGITIDRTPVTDKYLSDVTIYGVSLSKYTVIVPAGCDVYTEYAASLLCDRIEEVSGIKLKIKDDGAAESLYEILIGATNRTESAAAKAAMASDEYILKADGYKIVMLGNDYMIGGGVGAFTYDYIKYDTEKTGAVCEINNLPVSGEPMKYASRPAKSAILMIGDGMGQNHAAATLAYNASHGTEAGYTEFSASRLPVKGRLSTASLTTIQSGGTSPTDSAAAGTALSCGIKTLNSRMGMDKNDRPVQNIRELAVSLGKKTGVMSTELKEGATPAAFTIHWKSRYDYETIGSLQDKLDDIDLLRGDAEDALPSETARALRLLSGGGNGFFAMIEEANIDTWSHQNDIAKTTHCMARFDASVRYAMVFAACRPDTLLIVTADHETGGLRTDGKFTVSSHTVSEVPLYAIGDGSERLAGLHENILVPKVIASTWGVENFGG